MAIKKFKPTSPGRRFVTVSDFAEITKKEPEKSLVVNPETVSEFTGLTDKKGVEIYENTPVVGLEKHKDFYIVKTRNDKTIKAKSVVIASSIS